MKQNYILGGGIAGLIWAYYNPSFTILSQTIGGQFSNYFSMGPRFLEDCEASRKLLTDLKLPISPKKIKIGYKHGDQIMSTCTSGYKQKYVKKSRGILGTADTTTMNSGKSEMTVLTVDFKKLIDILVSEIGQKRLRIAQIHKIDTKTKEIFTRKGTVVFDYKTLVSTIPLPAFKELAGLRPEGEYFARNMTYVLLKPDFIDMNGFDFVYCAEGEPYHRLAKDKEGIVADVLGWRTLKEVMEMFPDAIDFKCAPKIQIVEGTPQEKLNDDVKFAGRYGTWDRKWKTEKVIEEAIKYGQ